MCSIAGIFAFRTGPDLVERLREAVRCMSRRGPDDFSLSEVAVGCIMGGNRLAIRGDAESRQPLHSENTTVYYNGEIYNWRAWHPDSNYDGVAIATAYKNHGLDGLRALRGEFAIALWDHHKERLLLARDAFGRRPLYFCFVEGGIAWASTESALLQLADIPTRYCATVQSSTYRHQFAVQEPYTSYDRVWSVPPGHVLVCDRDNLSLQRYYEPPTAYAHPEKEAYERLETAMQRSLSSRLLHDGGVAIPMSAGIDSGIIAFAANRMDVPFEVFSIVAMFGKETREAAAIYERARRLDSAEKIHLLEVTEEDYRVAVDDVFSDGCFDSARFDTGAVGLHKVLREVRGRHLHVLLDGTGGDEFFHGYKFRDEIRRPAGWPQDFDSCPMHYSTTTTLLDNNGKVERLGGHFSVEARFPLQDEDIFECASSLRPRSTLKWPLRRYLLEKCDYGPSLYADIDEKFGFSVQGRTLDVVVLEMRDAWLKARGLNSMPTQMPTRFPFSIGQTNVAKSNLDGVDP
jgi:asparagine synthase (glutamine-hydrolysing)